MKWEVLTHIAVATFLLFVGCVVWAPDAVAAEAPAKFDQLAPLVDSSNISSPPPSRTFSLGICFDQADRFNKEIVAAKFNLPIAKAGIRSAGAIPNPQFQLQAGFGPSFTYLETGQTQQFFWTQEIQTAGKRSKKIDVACANYELAQLQLEALRFDVHNRVRRAYAELAAAEAYAVLIESQREVGLRLVEIAKKRFQAGKAAQSEVLQSNLNVLQFDIQRNQAQGRLQQASAYLSSLIGDRPEHIEVIDVNDNGIFKLSAEKTDVVPAPNRPLPLLEKLFPVAYTWRPDLKAAQQQVFVNRRALTLAKSQIIPDVFIGSGYTYATFNKHYQPAGLVPVPDWLGQGAFLNVSVENPLFYQYQGEIKQAIGVLRQSERQVELLKSQIATDIITAYNSVDVARTNIFIYQKDLLPTALQVAQVSRRGYELGATDLATAIVAQQQYQQTLSSYFDAVVAYQNAWADLEKAMGVPVRL